MRASHGFIGLAAAVVVASGCNYVTGLENNTYDRAPATGGSGATASGGAGGATSSTGGANTGGAYPMDCSPLEPGDFGTLGFSCDPMSACSFMDLFDPRSASATTDDWVAAHFTDEPGEPVQVCPENHGQLILTPAVSDPPNPAGSEWYGGSRAGALYVDGGEGPILVAARVSVAGMDDEYQGAGISIYGDATDWLLLSLGLHGGPPVGVQAYAYSPGDSGAIGSKTDTEGNTEGILAACRTSTVANPWFLYYLPGEAVSSAENATDIDDAAIVQVATPSNLNATSSVQVGLTAHNYDDESDVFEARFRWAFVTNDSLASEEDCRARLKEYVFMAETADADVGP